MKVRQIATISVLIMMFAMPVMASLATDGSSGNLDLGVTEAYDKQRIYIKAYNLDVSSDYLINSTGDNTGYSFTTGASQDSITIPWTISKASGTNVYTVYLRAQSAGTVIDSVTIYVSDVEDSVNEDLFMSIAIPILVFVILIGIVTGFSRKMRKR